MTRSALCCAFEHAPLLPDFVLVTLIAITSARLLLNAHYFKVVKNNVGLGERRIDLTQERVYQP